MNEITQITIKKGEKNQQFLFISIRARQKLNRRVGWSGAAPYVISTSTVVHISILKQALMKQNNRGEYMNILSPCKHDIDQTK